MSEERSPALERVFRVADENLDDEAFVAGVMTSTSPRGARLLIAAAVLVVALPLTWLVGGPANDALQWLAQLVAHPLAGSGEGFTGPAVLPMNNVGAALVLGLLAVRAFARRVLSLD
jgi:hypothetical protein